MNKSNGLKSNIVYRILVDKKGYLWIATKEGVYRYSGYDLKSFTLAEGLYSEDVWDLYADSGGRLWLSSIFDQLAYIRDDGIHHAVLLNHKTVYPRHLMEYNGGITFLSPYHYQNSQALCRERNDTIMSYNLSQLNGRLFLKDGSTIVQCVNDSLCRIEIKSRANGGIDFDRSYLSSLAGFSELLLHSPIYFLHDNDLVCCKTTDSILYVMNTNTGELAARNFASKLNYVFKDDRLVYAITADSIHRLNRRFQIEKSYSILSTIGTAMFEGKNCSYFIDNPFWGKCLATYTDGVFINHGGSSMFRKTAIAGFNDFWYVGMKNDSMGYWWNRKRKTLAEVSGLGNVTYKTLQNIDDIEYVLRLDAGNDLVMNKNRLYRMNRGDYYQADNYYRRFRSFHFFPESAFDSTVSAGGFYGYVRKPGDFYLVSKGAGFIHFKHDDTTLSRRILGYERYDGLAYDSFRNRLWIYKADYIGIFKKDTLQSELTANELEKLGIKNIRQIIADKHGNVFIKDYDRLILFDPDRQTVRNLFADYVLDNASIALYGSTMIVAGKFGILFSEVTGGGKVTRPLAYPNIKGSIYSEILGMQVSQGTIILKTDSAVLTAAIPSQKELFSTRRAPANLHKLIGFYGGSARPLNNGDTIILSQKSRQISFDLINPLGSGVVRFSSLIVGGVMEGKEVSFPDLEPNKVYRLVVTARDDIWKSKEITLFIYIEPYWWQRPAVRMIFWASAIPLIVLFISGIIYFTRRIVARAHVKKRMQLELELKAVHAQINPHFIYNTLSVTQFFISRNKTGDALKHIQQFSKVLRAYLQSSRNRFITISDEIANLTNYIELQRTRFQDKFDYSIVSEEGLHPEDWQIPSLLLQPIVENAIHHGLFHRKQSGYLKITFAKVSDRAIAITVDDNGIGRKRAMEIDKDSDRTSVGNDLLKDLVTIFKAYEHMDIDIQYHDKAEPDAGTIVKVRIAYGA